jgi:hypothetical protein
MSKPAAYLVQLLEDIEQFGGQVLGAVDDRGQVPGFLNAFLG